MCVYNFWAPLYSPLFLSPPPLYFSGLVNSRWGKKDYLCSDKKTGRLQSAEIPLFLQQKEHLLPRLKKHQLQFNFSKNHCKPKLFIQETLPFLTSQPHKISAASLTPSCFAHSSVVHDEHCQPAQKQTNAPYFCFLWNKKRKENSVCCCCHLSHSSDLPQWESWHVFFFFNQHKHRTRKKKEKTLTSFTGILVVDGLWCGRLHIVTRINRLLQIDRQYHAEKTREEKEEKEQTSRREIHDCGEDTARNEG